MYCRGPLANLKKGDELTVAVKRETDTEHFVLHYQELS